GKVDCRLIVPMQLATAQQLRRVCAALALAAVAAANAPAPNTAAGVRALTGARTRVVWVQGDGADPYAAGFGLVLKGLDTEDGKGERVILGTRGSYFKPLIISDGKRIVFSSHRKDRDFAFVETFVVNFDGSGLTKLADGAALAAWVEP